MVNCARNLEKIWPKFKPSKDFIYLNLEMDDSGVQSLQQQLAQSYQFISKAQQTGGIVFVHCAQGRLHN